MKVEKDTQNLCELVKYYKKYKFLSILVVVLSLGYAGISLLSPIYEGKLLGCFEKFDKDCLKLDILAIIFTKSKEQLCTILFGVTF